MTATSTQRGAQQLLLNDGTGTFTEASQQLPPFPSPGSTTELADLDGDADLDLLSFDVLYLNDGLGFFTDASSRLPVGTAQLQRVGDFDGDGDLDILAASADTSFSLTHREALLLNDGQARFTNSRLLATELPERHAVAATFGDLDGDGAPDLVTSGGPPNPFGALQHQASLFVNDGHGRFEDRTDLFPKEVSSFRAAEIADLDGDGDQDIAFATRTSGGSGGGIRVYRNDGPQGYSRSAFGGLESTDLSLGDVDGDGDIDLLEAHASFPPFPDQLYLNDGSGTFAIAAGFPSTVESTTRVLLVDVERDGDLDAILCGPRTRLYVGDGTGAFVDVTGQLSFSDSESVAAGDVDDDGDIDLLTTHPAAGAVTLHLNDGRGTFTQGGSLAGSFREPVESFLIDLDEDGDLDAVVGESRFTFPQSTPLAHFFENRGAGTFRRARFALPPFMSTERAAFTDIDQDGDLDLASGDGVEMRLWFNLERQIAWHAVPRVGKPLWMNLRGKPGEAWILAFGTADDEHSDPEHGDVALGPFRCRDNGKRSSVGAWLRCVPHQRPGRPHAHRRHVLRSGQNRDSLHESRDDHARGSLTRAALRVRGLAL